MNIAYRVRDMQIAGTLSMVLFGVVLVFGIMNCVLGYRLLRFWMMIFGFLIGAGIGLFAIHQIGFGEKVGGSLLTQEVISFYFYTVRPTDTLDSRQ